MSDGVHKRALITGVCGQDGFYLARHLLARGYEVIGTSHRRDVSALDVEGRELRVLSLDLKSAEAIEQLVASTRPHEIYNLAARASSAQLFDDPLETADVNGVVVVRWLEAIRRKSPSSRFLQASSSEVFAGTRSSPQSEATAYAPTNAYGAAKAFADHTVRAYRHTHGAFACSAILFPHESPRRPPHFLVRKVTRAAVRIARGLDHTLSLGDLDARRDWSFAPDVVAAMHAMLQTDAPHDLVLASGTSHAVRDVCERAFARLGLDYRDYVRSDASLQRGSEEAVRVGDPALARRLLGWQPSLSFDALITLLVETAQREADAEHPRA